MIVPTTTDAFKNILEELSKEELLEGTLVVHPNSIKEVEYNENINQEEQ